VLKIEEIDDRNRGQFIDLIKSDVIKHVFAFYDIQNDPEHTRIHAGFENGSLRGYILTYTATDVLSVILECENRVAAKLIQFAPENHFVMHTNPIFQAIIKKRFPWAKNYLENWMVLEKEKAHVLDFRNVRRLSTKEDAAALAKLVLNRKDRPRRSLKKYHEWIAKMPIYGVYVGNELVSYAGSFIQLPQVWLIGGVYTDPRHRNKGYAQVVTSAVTREALKNAELAALFVRSSNGPAIRVYEKIGYRKVAEKLWVDVGTGLRP
jgi:GNAT superfamily N-acetyltransferase